MSPAAAASDANAPAVPQPQVRPGPAGPGTGPDPDKTVGRRNLAGQPRPPGRRDVYGTSVTSCLPSGLSEPGGAGLGTLGLPPSVLERMCRDAGFSRFRVHDVGDPANLYYEVRP